MQVQGDGETRAVTGQVTENGSPVSGVLVRAYRRSDGAFLGEKTTDGSGEYSIKIYADNSQVFVIAFDPTGGVNYNAVIKDKVVPV